MTGSEFAHTEVDFVTPAIVAEYPAAEWALDRIKLGIQPDHINLCL